MMARIDWLRDVGAGLGKDVLDRMGERNGWEGYGGKNM